MHPNVVLVMLATAILAGCAETAPEAVPPDVLEDPTGRPVQAAPTANEWEVGKWWGYHAYFGVEDSVGEHFNAIVVEDLGDTWRLGSDDPEMAAIDAMFGIPIIGHFTKDTLTSADTYETPFTWYDFPLEDGKEWLWMDDGDDGKFFAKATPQKVTVRNIEHDGWLVNVTHEDGWTFALYDHSPMVGWFTNLTIFDDEGRPDILARSMGFGDDWEGDAFATTAELESDAFHIFSPTMDPTNMVHTFIVEPEATHVWGIVFSFVAVGAGVAELIDPDGNRYEVVTAGDGDFDMAMLDRIPAIPGEWTLVMAGAGVASVQGTTVFSLVEETFTF